MGLSRVEVRRTGGPSWMRDGAGIGVGLRDEGLDVRDGGERGARGRRVKRVRARILVGLGGRRGGEMALGLELQGLDRGWEGSAGGEWADAGKE